MGFSSGGDGGGAAVAPFVGCKLRKIVDEAFVVGVAKAATFGDELWDTDGFHDNAVNPTRITFPQAGIYLVSARAIWAPANTGVRVLGLRRNGGANWDLFINQMAVSTNGEHTSMTFSEALTFAEGDYIEFMAWQGYTTNLNLKGDAAAANLQTTFGVTKVGEVAA